MPKKVLLMMKAISLVWAGAVEKCELSDVGVGCSLQGRREKM